MTPIERRMASVLRQRMKSSLVELASDLESIDVECILEHADELKRLRFSVDNKRHVQAWESRKAGGE